MTSVPPPGILREPLQVPKKTLLGPGPSNPHPAIIEAMTLPILGYLHPEFLAVSSCQKGLLLCHYHLASVDHGPSSSRIAVRLPNQQ